MVRRIIGRLVRQVVLVWPDEKFGLETQSAELCSARSAEELRGRGVSPAFQQNIIRGELMQYRRPQSVFVSAWCRREVLVLLAVTRVAGYGLQGPCKPLGRLGDAFGCGLAVRVVSAVVALCRQGRVGFVVFSWAGGDGEPSGTRGARAARSAA
jgi:hypothetical protein